MKTRKISLDEIKKYVYIKDGKLYYTKNNKCIKK